MHVLQLYYSDVARTVSKYDEGPTGDLIEVGEEIPTRNLNALPATPANAPLSKADEWLVQTNQARDPFLVLLACCKSASTAGSVENQQVQLKQVAYFGFT